MNYLAELEAITAIHRETLCRLKFTAFDVDGVLTDGTLHYQANGEATKIFSVKDGVGLKLLTDMGIHVAVITAKDSDMVRRRMMDLGIRNYFPGTKNKLEVVSKLAGDHELTLDQFCYVGDDMVDLPVLSAVGMSICPKDAYPLVRQESKIVLEVEGGKGVARAVADILLYARGKYQQAYQLTTSPTFERKR